MTLTHGQYGTPTYKSWESMLGRCKYPSMGNYARYGGRGVTFDPSWAKFEEFFADMGPRREGTTLDRIDGSLGYGPSNCRWATKEEQTANRLMYTTTHCPQGHLRIYSESQRRKLCPICKAEAFRRFRTK